MKIGNNWYLRILNITLICTIFLLLRTIDLKCYIESEKMKTIAFLGSLIFLILADIKNKIFLTIFLSAFLAFLLILILL
jgi:hypothetical protein